MWLLVGLGNPEPRYARNRHNVGFMVVDELWRRAGSPAFRRKLGAELSEATLAGEPVLLCKPMEFMNCSGLAVQRAAAFWKIPPEQAVVVHDELDVPFGRLKLSVGGGSGGHNGLQSIIQEWGSPDFARVRLGIGRPPAQWDAADYVLADFAEDERRLLPDLIGEAADASETIVKSGLPVAMNIFNKRKKNESEAGA
jgi:peptidyl-tRNA hydrolase, PTH1 family